MASKLINIETMVNNTLTFASEVLASELRCDTQTFDEAMTLVYSFMVIYHVEEAKLPYHINLLDILWANENAHSRILTQLLLQKSGDKNEILDSFLNYLHTKAADFPSLINEPIITAEESRIDVLIRGNKYCIIIENKVHNAIDQPSQIQRYIDKAINDLGYKIEHIFVVYLTRDGSKSLSDDSWGQYKKQFEHRFLDISFLDNILPWLEESVLPNCKFKDDFLRSALEQYIDHLRGIFNQRNINYKMNKELQVHIAQKLNLDANPENNYAILDNKSADLQRLKDQIDALKTQTVDECIQKWTKQLHIDFPKASFPQLTVIEQSQPPQAGVILTFEELKFSVLIEYAEYLYYGIGRYPDSLELDDNIQSIIAEEFEEYNQWWHGWKKTSFKEGYQNLTFLINKVLP